MRSKAFLFVCAAAIIAASGAAHGQVVVSQLYGGGGSTTGTPVWAHDWVELYNRGTSAVSIAGWSVQYAAGTGTTWNAQAIGGGPITSLNPGQYLLVRLGRGTASSLGAILSTADVVGPELGAGTIAMAATAGKVALVSNTTALSGTNPTGGALEDLVGYGTGTNGFEGAPASATGLTTAASLVRRLDGCFDTQANNFDFALGNAAPRSSTTTTGPCPTDAGDLTVTTTALPACDLGPAGAPVAYTFTVSNNAGNPLDAALSVAVPANLTFVSSVPAGTFSAGVVSIPVGTVTVGSPVAVTVNLTVGATGAGPAATVALSGPGTEANPANNGPVTGTSVFVPSNTPIAARAMLVVTDPAGPLAALASDVPGLPAGTKFLWGTASTEWFSRMFPSDNGERWIARGRTAAGAAADDVLLTYNAITNTFSLVAQQGDESVPGSGVLVGDMDQTPGINNAGDFVFSTTPTGASTAQIVLKSVGGVRSVAVQPGTVSPLLTVAPDVLAATNSAINITNAGAASFHTSTGVSATATGTVQDAVFAGDGSILLAREGTVVLGTGTVPGNQASSTAWQWLTIQSGSIQDTAPYISGDGSNSLLQGTIDAPTGTDPEIVVFNGNVVVQGGVTPIGSTTVSPSGILSIAGQGANWLATGTGTVGTLDWVIRNGVQVALEGTPAITGGTENLVSTFGAGAVNNLSDWAYTGFLNSPTNYNDVVLVLNGTRVLLRENDPIDLDNNGTVDGYVRLFRNARIAITADRKLYIVVEIGAGTQPCGTAQRTKVADALLVFDLAAGSSVVCCRGVTCTTVANAAACTAPAGIGISTFSGTTCTGQSAIIAGCCYADFNKSGVKDVADIFAFLSAWFANSPFSDVGGDGTGTRDVSDIFQFLSAWFVGCT